VYIKKVTVLTVIRPKTKNTAYQRKYVSAFCIQTTNTLIDIFNDKEGS